MDLSASHLQSQRAAQQIARIILPVLAQDRAVRAAVKAIRHADWFCSLPWYTRWWAMVRGR